MKNFEIDVLIENEFTEDQKELAHMFLDNTSPNMLGADATMVDVVMLVPNMFKSRTDARKNGWEGKEIPNGLSDLVVGKKKFRIWIFKPLKMN
jgi:hypothetical protein